MIMESERYKATRAFDGSEDGWGDDGDGDAGVMLLMEMLLPMSVTVAVRRQSSVVTHREHGH